MRISVCLLFLLICGSSFKAQAGTCSVDSASNTINIRVNCTPNAVGNGIADDSPVLAAAVAQANTASATMTVPINIYLPAGTYYIDNTSIPQFSSAGGTAGIGDGITGDGPHKTYVELGPDYSGDLFSWDNAYQSTGGPPVNSATDASGPMVKSLTVMGNQYTNNVQNAFMLYDRDDSVLMQDVEVFHMNGRCFSAGLQKTPSAGYMRESKFYHLKFYGCGTNSGIQFYAVSNRSSGITNVTPAVLSNGMAVSGPILSGTSIASSVSGSSASLSPAPTNYANSVLVAGSASTTFTGYTSSSGPNRITSASPLSACTPGQSVAGLGLQTGTTITLVNMVMGYFGVSLTPTMTFTSPNPGTFICGTPFSANTTAGSPQIANISPGVTLTPSTTLVGGSGDYGTISANTLLFPAGTSVVAAYPASGSSSSATLGSNALATAGPALLTAQLVASWSSGSQVITVSGQTPAYLLPAVVAVGSSVTGPGFSGTDSISSVSATSATLSGNATSNTTAATYTATPPGAAYSYTFTANTSVGSPTLSNIVPTSAGTTFPLGTQIYAAGIPFGASVVGMSTSGSTTSVLLSATTTAAGTSVPLSTNGVGFQAAVSGTSLTSIMLQPGQTIGVGMAVLGPGIPAGDVITTYTASPPSATLAVAGLDPGTYMMLAQPAPAMDLSSYGSGDTINQLVFTGLDVVNPSGTGLIIHNFNSGSSISTARFFGIRVEHPGLGDLLSIGDPTPVTGLYSGNESTMTFAGFIGNGSAPQFSTIGFYADTSTAQPNTMKFQGSINTGNGTGINIQSGTNIDFDFDIVAGTPAINYGATIPGLTSTVGSVNLSNATANAVLDINFLDNANIAKFSMPQPFFGSPQSLSKSGVNFWQGSGTSAAPFRLTADGNTASTANCFVIPLNTVSNFSISLSAVDTVSTSNWFSYSMPSAVLSRSPGATNYTAISSALSTYQGTGSAVSVSTTVDSALRCLNLTITVPNGDKWDVTASMPFAYAQ